MAKDVGNRPVPGGTVYLSLTRGASGGSARVGFTAPTSTPQPFFAYASGVIAVIYQAPPFPLPVTGTETLAEQNMASSPTVVTTTTYSFPQYPSRHGSATPSGSHT